MKNRRKKLKKPDAQMRVCVRTHALLYSCSVRPIPFDSFFNQSFPFSIFWKYFFLSFQSKQSTSFVQQGSRIHVIAVWHCYIVSTQRPELKRFSLFFFSLFILCYCCQWSKQSFLRFFVNYWVLYYMIIYKIFQNPRLSWFEYLWLL